jgi:hypothetical protein
VNVSATELELGIGLTERLTSEEFHPADYQDEYRIRVLAMLEEKSKGKEVTFSVGAATGRQSRRYHGSVKAQHGENSGQEETSHWTLRKEEESSSLSSQQFLLLSNVCSLEFRMHERPRCREAAAQLTPHKSRIHDRPAVKLDQDLDQE